MRAWGTLLVAVLCLLSAGPASANSGPSGPDPLVAKWPAWPYPVSCGFVPFDPVTVFSGPTEAELGTQPSAVALRAFLHSGDFPGLPTQDWRLLAENATHAEFVRGRLAAELTWLSFEQSDGAWKWISYSSDCDPISIMGRGPVINWTLAYEQQPPLRGNITSIEVNLSGGPCDGGRSLNRHAHPVFRTLGRKLLLTVWIDPIPPGNYTCPALIEPPFRVRLPSRLGNRHLFEGGTYPPLSAGQTRREER